MVVSKAEVGIEHCKKLDPQLDFSRALGEADEILESMRKSRSAAAVWQDKLTCMQTASKIYRLFKILVDMASLEYKNGCHRHAVAQLKLALDLRELVPSAAVGEFVAYCKNDPRACQLELSGSNRATEARSLRADLKFFEQASSKLRVLAAKMLLQLGGESDVAQAGQLFGQAIEIGLKSCRN